MIILNTTDFAFDTFCNVQRLACKGMRVVDMPTTNAEEVYRMCDSNEVAMVIVDPYPHIWEFINDVCNGVSCPVVTLWVCTEIIDDDHIENDFQECNPDNYARSN